MKILIAGGHFSPALALIDALPKGTEIAVVGRKYAFEGDSAESYEYQLCQARNIPFFPIRAGRFQRVVTVHTIPSLIKLPVGFIDAYQVLKQWKPDIVVVFGGYIALPVAAAARLLHIPIIVHEQTTDAGLANKIIGKFADKICISFESSRQLFPNGKVELTGNPIRHDIFKTTKKIPIPESDGVVYITGGSTGSHIINQIAGKIIPELVKKYTVIHQTGDSQVYHDFNALSRVQESLPHDVQCRYILKKFVPPDEIGYLLQKADVVVSRAGINTVTELMLLEKPSILIPLSTGQKNEQLRNAQFMASTGLAKYILQDEASPENLFQLISGMIKNKKQYIQAFKKTDIIDDADRRLVNVIQSVYDISKNTTAASKIPAPDKL